VSDERPNVPAVVELCHADHLNDPAILNRWLANKTPEIVGSWIINRAIRCSWQSRTAASLQWARSPTRVRSLSTMYRRTQGFVVLVEPCSLPSKQARSNEALIDAPFSVRNGPSLLSICRVW
jgi:hypothetical protein